MRDPRRKWPSVLWLVRHGESAGNVAQAAANAARAPTIDIGVRDMDVPLSHRGERQARSLGRRLGGLPVDERPTAILCSPYLRAVDTAALALREAGIDDVDIVVDERLREREFGILDRLTRAGIEERYPEQAAARAFLGKFYHRPPGGESWCDVVLRLRSVLGTITRDHPRERLLVVTHQVVVLMFRYLCERMTEAEVLTLDRSQQVANCSVTTYEFDPSLGRSGKLALRGFNEVDHIEQAQTEVTDDPDIPAGPH